MKCRTSFMFFPHSDLTQHKLMLEEQGLSDSFFFVGSTVSCSLVLRSLLLLPLAFCCSSSGFCITLFIFSDFPLPVFCQSLVLLPAFWILDLDYWLFMPCICVLLWPNLCRKINQTNKIKCLFIH